VSYQTLIEDMDAERLKQTEELKKTRFVEGLATGMTQTMAAEQAGYIGRDLRTPGKLISPDELRQRFQQIAERKGLTMDRLGDKIAEHLEARANQTLEGKLVTQSEAPDYKIQQKAIDQWTGLIGMQDAQKASQAGSSITVSVTGAAADRLLRAFEGDNL